VVSRFAALFVLPTALAGCGSSPPADTRYHGPPIPWAYEEFPTLHAPSENLWTEPKHELGRLLFYDPILSSDRTVACATCHSAVWGLSDGLPFSIGVGGVGPTGPGRTGDASTSRNAPTLWNAAYKSALFWDGLAPTLEDQIPFPLEKPNELGRVPARVAADLATIPDYVTRFQAAFPGEQQPVTAENLARAIATFERSFVSRDAPYDQYVAGDAGALDADTVRGMFLFGEAGCADCHSPPLFESERYADRGVVSQLPDEGRMDVTGASADENAFHVPTLRNVRESNPYFHDGSSATLAEAVEREVARSAQTGLSRELSADEIALLVRFLDKALTDTRHAPNRACPPRSRRGRLGA
jgi:cytochrome c peroxidase